MPYQDDDRKFLTMEQFLAAIRQTSSVHIYKQDGKVLRGANVDRRVLIMLAHKNGVELAGAGMTKRNHGICVWNMRNEPLYVESINESLPK